MWSQKVICANVFFYKCFTKDNLHQCFHKSFIKANLHQCFIINVHKRLFAPIFFKTVSQKIICPNFFYECFTKDNHKCLQRVVCTNVSYQCFRKGYLHQCNWQLTTGYPTQLIATVFVKFINAKSKSKRKCCTRDRSFHSDASKRLSCLSQKLPGRSSKHDLILKYGTKYL